MSDFSVDAVRFTSRAGFIWGILTIILGVLAFAAPMFSGIAVATLAGIFLLAAGIAQAIFAFKAGSFGEGLFTFLFGASAILGGAVMLARPLFGLASITVILGAYFLVDGLFGIVNSFRLKPAQGWGWMLVSSIAAVVLGVMILNNWPSSAAWVVGTLLGVRLVFSGWSMITLGSIGEAVADEADATLR